MLGVFSLKRNMIIIKQTNGELTLINTCRLNDETEKELFNIGKPTNVVRIGDHCLDDYYYFNKLKCKMWALKPIDVGAKPHSKWGKGANVVYEEFSDENPPACLKDWKVQVYSIPIAPDNVECILYFPSIKAIISCDYIANFDKEGWISYSELQPTFSEKFFTLFGFKGVLCTHQFYLKHANVPLSDLVKFEKKLHQLDWDTVITCHGAPYLKNAKTTRLQFIKNMKWEGF